MKKIKILIPSLITLTCLPIVTSVSCSKPKLKTMIIKLDGEDFPESIFMGDQKPIAAYDSDGEVVEGATFTSSDDSIFTITENVLKGVSEGIATITCTAAGYATIIKTLTVTMPTPPLK